MILIIPINQGQSRLIGNIFDFTRSLGQSRQAHFADVCFQLRHDSSLSDHQPSVEQRLLLFCIPGVEVRYQLYCSSYFHSSNFILL